MVNNEAGQQQIATSPAVAELRAELARRGWTMHKDFRVAMGWNRPRVTRLFRGTYLPRIDEAIKIADEFGVPLDRWRNNEATKDGRFGCPPGAILLAANNRGG